MVMLSGTRFDISNSILDSQLSEAFCLSNDLACLLIILFVGVPDPTFTSLNLFIRLSKTLLLKKLRVDGGLYSCQDFPNNLAVRLLLFHVSTNKKPLGLRIPEMFSSDRLRSERWAITWIIMTKSNVAFRLVVSEINLHQGNG
jgi:hypothetical protein